MLLTMFVALSVCLRLRFQGPRVHFERGKKNIAIEWVPTSKSQTTLEAKSSNRPPPFFPGSSAVAPGVPWAPPGSLPRRLGNTPGRVEWNSLNPPASNNREVQSERVTKYVQNCSSLLDLRIFQNSSISTIVDIQSAADNDSIQPKDARQYNDLMWLDFSNVAFLQGRLILQSPDAHTLHYVRHRLRNRLPGIFPGSARPDIETRPQVCSVFREETALWNLYGSSYTGWKNAYHFHNNILVPLLTNVRTHRNCNDRFQCDPPLVLYTDTRVKWGAGDFRHHILQLLFPDQKSVDIRHGKTEYCFRYLSWGAGPPAFLDHITKNSVDISPVIKFTVSQFQQKLYHKFSLTPPQNLLKNVIFFGRTRPGSTQATRGRRLLHTPPDARWVANTEPFRRACHALDLNFTEVLPKTFSVLPLHRLLAMFYSASIMAGPHGAGLANVLYARQGTVLIDYMTHDSEWIPEFSRMAVAAGAFVVFAKVHGGTRERGTVIDSEISYASLRCALSVLSSESDVCRDGPWQDSLKIVTSFDSAQQRG